MIINVELRENSYNIVIERGALNKFNELISTDRKVLIVTDSGVPAQYAKSVARNVKDGHIVTIPQGESSKSIDNLQFLCKKMLELGFTRKDCVVAVGGGVVGDLAGFAASVYMRGIDFYNVPTTVLSQVDSSVGGKVAVNFEGIKNILGAFYQPKMVIIDPDVLDTLD
ncbi:MAG: iron-containing alcohol dehydrogenase, partial [Clostridia bacterium]|nr:iron-containing alcohol dehydrogenase [Clostridia bacterium]